jgi:alkanesulfonate monooxygenase SsuD/methylene tetrahydromethanopterin reductase-like flavin-dependent oxidoreductase (luciferase family)
VCRELWSNPTASYRSPELEFDRIHQAPRPRQAGGVPIWVSGTVNRRSMDRLARFGAGWIPWGDDAADIATGIARMRREMAARDRTPDDVQVMSRVPTVLDSTDVDLNATFAPAARLHALGVTDFRVGMRIPSGRDDAEAFLTRTVAAFRTAVGRHD